MTSVFRLSQVTFTYLLESEPVALLSTGSIPEITFTQVQNPSLHTRISVTRNTSEDVQRR